MSLLERRRSAQQNASDMTTDVARVYGLGGLRNLGATGTIGMRNSSGGSPMNMINAAIEQARAGKR